MAAEIERDHPAPGVLPLASMRPRRMAAEIVMPTAASACAARSASMRPRRMAAEICAPTATAAGARAGFNEAAANGRGNRARR